jgi:hypothetical protein
VSQPLTILTVLTQTPAFVWGNRSEDYGSDGPANLRVIEADPIAICICSVMAEHGTCAAYAKHPRGLTGGRVNAIATTSMKFEVRAPRTPRAEKPSQLSGRAHDKLAVPLRSYS